MDSYHLGKLQQVVSNRDRLIAPVEEMPVAFIPPRRIVVGRIGDIEWLAESKNPGIVAKHRRRMDRLSEIRRMACPLGKAGDAGLGPCLGRWISPALPVHPLGETIDVPCVIERSCLSQRG